MSTFTKFWHSLEVKCGCLLDMKFIGTLYRLTIWYTNNLAKFSTRNHFFTSRKCADLLSWSMITHIPSYLFAMGGGLSTKSIAMCSHFYTRIGKGWSHHEGFCLSACWYCNHYDSAYEFAMPLIMFDLRDISSLLVVLSYGMCHKPLA